MTCEQCKYHSYIAGIHFCDSRNHKRKTVRISQKDAEKDIDCYWAGELRCKEIEMQNKYTVGDEIHFKSWNQLKTQALKLSSMGYGVGVIGFENMSNNILTITELPEKEIKCKTCEHFRNPDYTRCHECKTESEDKE